MITVRMTSLLIGKKIPDNGEAAGRWWFGSIKWL